MYPKHFLLTACYEGPFGITTLIGAGLLSLAWNKCPIIRTNNPIAMKRYSILFILLTNSLYSFAQLGNSPDPSLRFVLLLDSITGEKTSLGSSLAPNTPGKLLVEADPNDIRKEIYDKQLLIEVIHARGTSAMTVIPLTGLKEFETNDVLKTLRPRLESGDRIVITFRMMADAEPMALMISVR